MLWTAGTTAQRRNNVNEVGAPDGRPMLFAHGFGCSQEMWRHVTPGFVDHRVVLFDHVGAGGSDLSAYDRAKYDSLHGYADDVVEIVEELDLRDVVFVGHSVSAMIGVLAAIQAPSRFSELVLVGPSPRYLNDDGYVGGFDQADIDTLLEKPRRELPRLVLGDGSRDHGQPRTSRARRRALAQLLSHRPCDRPSLRRRDVPVRQPSRPSSASSHPHSSCSAPTMRSRRCASARTCISRSPTANWSS